MDYQQHFTEHRRLLILRHLADLSPPNTTHEQDIKHALAAQRIPVGSDLLHADLQWLHDRDLLLVSRAGGVLIATLTAKGGDVQQGLSTVPGVARPEPI